MKKYIILVPILVLFLVFAAGNFIAYAGFPQHDQNGGLDYTSRTPSGDFIQNPISMTFAVVNTNNFSDCTGHLDDVDVRLTLLSQNSGVFHVTDLPTPSAGYVYNVNLPALPDDFYGSLGRNPFFEMKRTGSNWDHVCYQATFFDPFSVGEGPTPTPTPSVTPSPTPTPSPAPSDNELLQSIDLRLISIGVVLNEILNRLGSVLESMVDLAKESTLALIGAQIDKFTFDLNSYLKVSGNLGSTWEAGTAQGHGFIATTDNITLADKNETSVLLIKNPSGSGKTIRLRKVMVGAGDGSSGLVRVYRNPAVTSNGGTLPIGSLKSGNATMTQAFEFPVIFLNEPRLDSIWYTSFGREVDYSLGLYVDPGESLLVTLQRVGPDKGTTISVTWLEE